MASNGNEKGNDDLYAVMGLKKECTTTELRSAYKKLALRWHPDRCSSMGDSEFVDESKKKFQAIQEAYSVLSDSNKRFLYDVGAYNSDDDDHDQNGMGDFLNEMATMMNQSKPSENNSGDSFEQLQDLFNEMFQGDATAFSSSSSSCNASTFTSSCSFVVDTNAQQSPFETNSMGMNDPFAFDPRGGTSAGFQEGEEQWWEEKQEEEQCSIRCSRNVVVKQLWSPHFVTIEDHLFDNLSPHLSTSHTQEDWFWSSQQGCIKNSKRCRL